MAVALAVALAIWKFEKSEKIKISAVLRMGLPIVENLSGPCATIFSLFEIPQLHYNKKSKNGRIILIFPDSPDIPRGAP